MAFGLHTCFCPLIAVLMWWTVGYVLDTFVLWLIRMDLLGPSAISIQLLDGLVQICTDSCPRDGCSNFGYFSFTVPIAPLLSQIIICKLLICPIFWFMTRKKCSWTQIYVSNFVTISWPSMILGWLTFPSGFTLYFVCDKC